MPREKMTGKMVTSKSSKVLTSKETGVKSKSIAASALSQAKAPRENDFKGGSHWSTKGTKGRADWQCFKICRRRHFFPKGENNYVSENGRNSQEGRSRARR